MKPQPLALLIAALLLLAGDVMAEPAATVPGQPEPIDFADYAYDHWYLVTTNNKPTGYYHAWMSVQEDDRIITGYEEVGVEKHEGELLHTRTRVVWTEARPLKPLSIQVEQANGSTVLIKTYRFTDDGIVLTSTQDGRSIEQTLPAIKEHYLTPSVQYVLLKPKLMPGKKEQDIDDLSLLSPRLKVPASAAFDTLDPVLGLKPYRTSYQQKSDQTEPFELADGSKIDATPWSIAYSILPGFEQQVWIDAQGREVGYRYQAAGLTKVIRLADEHVADTEFDPPEMAGQSVVVPDKPIKGVSKQRQIVYELHAKAISKTHQPMQSGHQRVELLEPGVVRVTLDLDKKPAPAAKSDRPVQAHHKASVMVDHTNKAVAELAKRAVKKLDADPKPIEIANACRRAVTAHMTGTTMAVGDGTASEAARTGRGDCTESAVLLAALLRAHDIPSRCVTGLVYSAAEFAGQRDVFVYHMWTQAWIETGNNEGYWLDLDAALGRYSAGYIALGASAMGVDAAADQAALLPFMQDLKIKVIKTTR